VIRFGRDQHQVMLRQLYHIDQVSTVASRLAAYVESFSELIDQLTMYEPNLDTMHYVTRFIDGLNILRVVVAIQCPKDLDTSYSLAPFQEEVGNNSRHCQHMCRQQAQLPAPVPILDLPPPRRPLLFPAPPTSSSTSNEETSSSSADTKQKQPQTRNSSIDSNWSALRNYRRARGLCYTCGE
jgi:hypothetical protein